MTWTTYHVGLLMSDREPIELFEREKGGFLVRNEKGFAKSKGDFEGTVNGCSRRLLTKEEVKAATKLDQLAWELYKRAEKGEVLLAQRRVGDVCEYLYRETENEPRTTSRTKPMADARRSGNPSRPAAANRDVAPAEVAAGI